MHWLTKLRGQSLCETKAAPPEQSKTRAVLSPGNRAKLCKFRYVKPVGNFMRKIIIAIERENSHFRRPHSHLTPRHQRTPKHIGIRLISPESTDHGLHLMMLTVYIYASPSILKQPDLKTGVSLLNDSTRKTLFDAKWLFKVIQGHLFQCR